MLGRVVVKGQKRLAILDQLGNGLVVFDAVGFDEEIESSAGPGLGFRECPIFCVSVIWSMLPERSKDDDDFERTAGRTAEGLQAA